MLMGNLRDGVDIGNVAVGIAQRLNIDGLGIGPNGVFHLLKIMHIHKAGFDAVKRQGVRQQVAGTAVDGLLGNNMLSHSGQCLNGVTDGGCAGGNRKASRTALKGRNPILEYPLGAVCQAAVNIARIRQAETVGCVLGIMKYIRGGGIDGNGSGIGRRIRLLLTYMKLKGFKFIFRHRIRLLKVFFIHLNTKNPGLLGRNL